MGDAGPNAPAGWYPDPDGGGRRYWDGWQWGDREAEPAKRSSTTDKVILGGVAVAVLIAVAVIGIVTSSGGEKSAHTTTATKSMNEPIFIPKPSTLAPVSIPCRPAPPVLVDIINGSFTSGEHLEHMQAVHAPEATYVGGNIFDSTGRKVSSQDTWAELDGAMFAITSDARRRTLLPDGRHFPGIEREWPEYNAAVSKCVGAVERAAKAGG